MEAQEAQQETEQAASSDKHKSATPGRQVPAPWKALGILVYCPTYSQSLNTQCTLNAKIRSRH